MRKCKNNKWNKQKNATKRMKTQEFCAHALLWYVQIAITKKRIPV